MIATFHGQLFVKLQTGDITIAVNPVGKESGKKTTRFGSDICLVTTNLPICTGVEQVDNAGKTPFVINGPGEYEVKGISIHGVQSEYLWNGEEKINTIYTFTFDGIRVCVLGALNEKLDAEARDKISSCDVLFIPVLEHEKNNYLSAKDAVTVANNLDAKIIIPVGFDEKTLPIFLKEAGATGVAPVEKLTLKKKELEGKEGVVVVLDEV